MYSKIRPWLFRMDPERAHRVISRLLRLAGSLPPAGALLRKMYTADDHPVQAFGLRFRNPVGLAAGYDKDAIAWRGLACLGFGHLELGTVTLQPQPGNPAPRLFRLPADQALINRMGFPGQGAEIVARRLVGRRPAGLIVGVNLGMNKATPLENAASDYLALLRIFTPLADYLAVNVSSPNTAGLRRLQGRQMLADLLAELVAERQYQSDTLGRHVPLLVKVSPDLTNAELDDVLQVLLDQQVDGIIATNTTLARDGLTSPLAGETGGLSGAPLRLRSTWLVREIIQRTGGRLPVIAVGGILSPQDALEKLDAGAVLVQLYTGLIYAGPSLVKKILTA